ncbi:MAG: hypothetical protein KA450_14335 [Bacteroidia bacterium]|nr:hypothetical protein [Bacteroidia bacterium]
MKKTMKSIFLTVLATVLVSFASTAQNSEKKLDDAGRITLAAFVAPQVAGLPDAAKSMLSNKLSQIATQNGMGGSAKNERFIITCNIVVLTKDILPGPPPMTALSMDVTLYIGDGIAGTKFASKSITVKGVGTNETKAYIEGIKMIKPSDPGVQAFVEEGKKKIMAYYNTKCDMIIQEAKSLATQNKQEEAIYKLTAVPDVCKECFEKCLVAIEPIYKQKIERDCKIKFAEAKNLWNANQNIDAANQAGALLASIEPQASCYKEAQGLSTTIAKKVTEIDKREWAFKMKEQEQTSEMIRAYRDVGVAYGNGQPDSIEYNVNGWW